MQHCEWRLRGRESEEVCAPGYTGRKRGEVVRSRTTILQAHTQQWLGTFSGAGNGDYIAELVDACQVVTRYLHSRDIPLSRGLLRPDGLYGNASVLTRIQQAGAGLSVAHPSQSASSARWPMRSGTSPPRNRRAARGL